MNPSIVAEPTVIVHVVLETTSPVAAVASWGCVGDGDADGLPVVGLPVVGLEDGLALDAAPGLLDGPAAGVGAADVDGLGVGLGLADVGQQMMIRMQVLLGVGVGVGADPAADAWPPPSPRSPAVRSSGATASAASRLMTAPPRPRRTRPPLR